MLDTATKKRIDDCRDILVGKLPDPKAQIEQITIALIYKFMDDMDKEAIELGGKAKFFTNYTIPDPDDPKKKRTIPFAQYSWDNLFNTKVTASEMLRLYSEAIVGMDKNPNIPPLFRNIFKNAFLPYRDPETLKLFLKTINEFEYSHSEKLGDAFEYLLSVMGSQGDAGQFRTPRHIIDFIVAVVDPAKTDTILDPACGTAGFLISAFKHIKEKNKKGITPDERKKLIQNFVGYDISPDMVRLSLVNLYLHGFSDPHIHEYDTLTSEDRWNETFDVVLANPPFMSPKGGIRPHKKFSITSNRSEVLFIDYIAEHLNPKGRAGIIVPEGVIFQSGTAYKDLRKMLVDNYLYAVVSLPSGIFNPYSGVKTSILLMDKELAKKSNEILFVKIENDGYNLGAQRNAVKGSQLDEAVEIIKQFREGNFEASAIAHVFTKEEIAKNGDCNLSGERYKITLKVDSLYKWKEIGEVVDLIVDGDWIESKDQSEFGIRLIQTGNVGIAEFKDKGEKARYISDGTFQRLNCTEIFPEDVLVSRLPDPVGRACLVPNLNSRMITAVDCSIIRFNTSKIIPKLFVYYTKTLQYYKNIAPYLTGSSRSRISRTNLEKIKIPLPPLSIQEEIVAEIEGHQKIIDGAKAVVENYKPAIAIDLGWEMVELGEVCDFSQGIQVDLPLQLNSHKDGYERFLRIENYTQLSEDFRYIPKELSKNKFVSEDDVVVVRYGATAGFIGRGFEGVLANNLFKVAPIRKNLTNPFLFFLLSSVEYQKKLTELTAGGAMPALSFKTVKEILIPIPPIETQNQIVSQIEKEQALVNANKQLIEIFEQKIKDRIAKVWGAEKGATAYIENDVVSIAAEK